MKFLAVLLSLMMVSGASVSAHDDASHSHSLAIEGAWAPHTGKRTMSAAVYFTIENGGAAPDALTGVETPLANTAMLHQSKEVDGIMIMDHVEAMPIPAGGSASLAPGGYHIMLMQLTQPLKRGEVFPLTLTFEKAGDVTISVEITGIGGPE